MRKIDLVLVAVKADAEETLRRFGLAGLLRHTFGTVQDAVDWYTSTHVETEAEVQQVAIDTSVGDVHNDNVALLRDDDDVDELGGALFSDHV